MKKVVLIALFAAFILSFSAIAHEGMWLPMLLNRNYEDMKENGLKLKPQDIYDINNSSIKDAIVHFGKGCTGEIISSEGLLLTNHHCGFDQVRSHSTVENDILTNGWWAMDRNEEKPNPGLTASILIRMEDVTEKILDELSDEMTEAERKRKTEKVGREIALKAMKGTKYNATVKNFFHGNEYYLFVYITYKDVRLVGAPPQSVGKFGGDTDNWIWPRHTGDFSMFRIYTAPDGSPAEYNPDNVPLKPKHHLPISLKGVEEGDFTMIMGFPGSTDRYLSSFGVEQAIEIYNPSVVEVRDLKLKIMKKHMDADDAVRLKLAAKYASTANYWKYYIGQTEQLKNNHVYDRKVAIERDFKNWYSQNPELTKKYGKTLQLLEEGYQEQEPFVKSNVYIWENGLQGSLFGLYAFETSRLLDSYMRAINSLEKRLTNAEEEEEINELKAKIIDIKSKITAELKSSTQAHYLNYDASTDRELIANLWQLYYNNIPVDQQPDFFEFVREELYGNMDWFADSLFANSMLTDSTKLYSFLDNPTENVLNADYGILAGRGLVKSYMAKSHNSGNASEKINLGYRLFVEGLQEMQPDVLFYPDANSTPRVTYGTVASYEPKDGIKYLYYTTIEGVMQKEDPTNSEFMVEDKLKALYNAKDYGQYADENGELRTCFIHTTDITGGNSGSPVMNAKGELIGCAFDSNWEAMSGDISYENSVQRTISVDARYILFIIDKLGGAGHLVNEMTLRK